VVVGKETGHKGGQMLHYDACHVATAVSEKANLWTKWHQVIKESSL